MANRAQPFNAAALGHMGVPTLATGLDGRGIAIGVVDYGFDVLHPCLRRKAGGPTRLRSLWDQSGGRFAACDIDRIIAAADRAGSRSAPDRIYDPHANYFGRCGVQGGAHGTLMASIAGGSVVGGYRGVAPEADLIAVHLALPDCAWKEEDVAGVPTWADWQRAQQPVWNGWRSYDESEQIVAALDDIYESAVRNEADGLVINLSIGAYGGAHDGASPVHRKITEIAERSASGDGLPCAIVVAVGNAGIEDGHFTADLTVNRPSTLEWRMQQGDRTQNKLEIWYEALEPLELTISWPGAGSAGSSVAITPGETHPIEAEGFRIGIADHEPSARGPLSRVRILIHPPFIPHCLWAGSTGEITFQILCRTQCSVPVRLHAWVERDDGVANRSTLYPSHPASTLSSLATARGAIVVAGHDLGVADRTGPLPLSSLGPAPWGDASGVAPLVSAPARGIWGARSKSAGFTQTSGTSAAAALVSGVLALAMQQLIAQGSDDARRLGDVIARRMSAAGKACPRFGYGPLSFQCCVAQGGHA